jgi:hypothetical protein
MRRENLHFREFPTDFFSGARFFFTRNKADLPCRNPSPHAPAADRMRCLPL